MKHSFFFFAACLLLWATPVFAQESERDSTQWQLTRNEQSIKVYVRDVPGTSRKEFKGVMELPYKWEEVFFVVGDFPNFNQWISSYEKSEIIKTTPEGIVYEHHHTKTPFLTRPRDVIHKIEQRKLENGFVRSFTSIPDFMPEEEGVIRMPVFDGYWAGRGTEKGHTLVSHVVTLSPGGNIGDYLSNSNVSTSSFNTMIQLRNYMERRSAAGGVVPAAPQKRKNRK